MRAPVHQPTPALLTRVGPLWHIGSLQVRSAWNYHYYYYHYYHYYHYYYCYYYYWYPLYQGTGGD